MLKCYETKNYMSKYGKHCFRFDKDFKQSQTET